MTTDTASPAGIERNAVELSTLSKANSFVVVTVNSSTTPAPLLSLHGGTNGDGSADEEAIATVLPVTSSGLPDKAAMTGLASENESTAIIGVMSVVEEDGQQPKVPANLPASSEELESSAAQVTEPKRQAGPAAVVEAHSVDEEPTTDPTMLASAPQAANAATQAKDPPCKTAPMTAASSQRHMPTRANMKLTESEHQGPVNKTSSSGIQSNHESDEDGSEGPCDVCLHTFKSKDLTKIFVEVRKRLPGNSLSGQLCPFMLCSECKEPLIKPPAPSGTSDDSSSAAQRKEIVAKLHERALNSQPATQTSNEEEASCTVQPTEPPGLTHVHIQLSSKGPTNEGTAVLKCCVPSCSNRSDEPPGQSLSFYRFPRSIALKKQWAEAMGRKGWLPLPTTVVCSEHFRPSDMINGCPRSGVPKPDAIPSIFKGRVAAEEAPRQEASGDIAVPEVESVLYNSRGKAVVSLLQRKTSIRGRDSIKTRTTHTNTSGVAVKRVVLKEASPPRQVEKRRKKGPAPLSVKDVMEMDTSSFWLKTLSNRSVNFVHIVHRPLPCITRSVTVSPDMSVTVAVENARLSLLPCGTPVPNSIDNIETLQRLLRKVEALDKAERNDNWQLRKQSTLKLVSHLLQEVCRDMGSTDSQYGVLSSITDQIKELL